ncbi:GntR family transcriptional regulator [Streptomyces fulvoviolaceus]|uniref:GntR family transcriptional regulator n=1 Tax=Streptomyces fulvoviolaceus TaxID=285535 RepID=UPI0004C95F25|nr:GntR family transcriptional regulator [Streptomyces fulvoviolaceus]
MTAADRVRNSADVIAAELRTSIRRGDLLPGTRLIQERLASDLKVSRIPLREALHALAAEGLIEVQPQRGMIVAELSHDDIAELFALCLQLEPPLAEEIVRGCRERDIDELQALADQMREKGAGADGRAALNYQFHRRIYELSERRIALRFVDQLLHLVEPYSRLWVRSGDELQRIDEEHQSMVDALKARDAQALRDVITAHVEGARDHVLAAHRISAGFTTGVM